MSFATDTAVQRIDDHHFSASLTPLWSSLVGIHGGYSAAIVATAVEAMHSDSQQAIRSFTVQFVRSPAAGEVDISATTQRASRSTTFTTAQMHQDGKLLLLASAVSGLARGGLEYDDLRSPRPADPGATPRFASAIPGMHFAQFELMMDPDIAAFSGAATARMAGWMRPIDPEPVTIPWLICAADFFPPAVFTRTTGPVGAASVDYSVQLLTSDPASRIGPAEYVYADTCSSVAAEGFAVEDGTIWAPDGHVLATSRQFRLSGV